MSPPSSCLTKAGMAWCPASTCTIASSGCCTVVYVILRENRVIWQLNELEVQIAEVQIEVWKITNAV